MSKTKKRKTKESEAHRRAECILKARSGLTSVTAAASELGVSRKTYYQWEAKAIDSMIKGLCENESGRPALPSESEKERELRKRVDFLEKQNADFEKREDLIRAACKLKIDLIQGRAEKKCAYRDFGPQG